MGWSMKIWVDADALPVVIRELLIRCAQRRQILTHFVANQYFQLPESTFLKWIVVKQEPDAADHYILTQIQQYDLVITQDIPLAAAILASSSFIVISPSPS